jgi:signal transduction histidine kinase
MIRLEFPSARLAKASIVFDDGSFLALPKEYLKTQNSELLQKYYLWLLDQDRQQRVLIGTDPVGFNYVAYEELVYVGLIVIDSNKQTFNNNKKKHPDHRFHREYISRRIVNEHKLRHFEEYIPIQLVTQNLHELRGLNSKISQHVDTLMNINDETYWEERFDQANESYKKIYVASRMIKFILDNTKLFNPDFFEKLKMNYDRQFVLHRCVSKIVKIYRNNFKKDRTDVVFTARSNKQLKGDKEYFEIIVKILVENAIKYSLEAKRIPPKIDIAEKGNNVTVEVQSYGHLIPDEEEKNLFAKGFRASINSRQAEGTGMGLYNAAMLIKHFNGSLTYVKKIIVDEPSVKIGWNIFRIDLQCVA